MIVIHILVSNKDQAIEIADFLIEEKLLLDAVIDDTVIVRKKSENGKFYSEDKTRLMGRTRALLFNLIDSKLRKLYPNQMPILYSVPIVHMDWEQSHKLIEETAKV